MSLPHSPVTSVRPLKGSITAVGKGEVSIRLANGMKLSFRTDREFEYGDMVLVMYDFQRLEVTGVMLPEELDVEQPKVPACPEKQCGVEDHPVEEAPSRSLTVALEEFFLEGEV